MGRSVGRGQSWRRRGSVGFGPLTEIVATFTSTPRLAKRGYRAAFRWYSWLEWGLTVVLALMSLLYWDLLPLIIAVAYVALMELSIRASLRRVLKGPLPATLTITDDELRVDLGDFWFVQSWTSVISARRVRDFWVVRYSRVAATSFPTSAFTSFQDAAFADLMRVKGLLRD